MIGASRQLPVLSVCLPHSVIGFFSAVTILPVPAALAATASPAASLHTATDPTLHSHLQPPSKPATPTQSQPANPTHTPSDPSLSASSSEPSPSSCTAVHCSTSSSPHTIASPQTASHQCHTSYIAPLQPHSRPPPIPSHSTNTMTSSVHPSSLAAGYSSSSAEPKTPSHHVAPKSSLFGPIFDNPWSPFQDKSLKDGWEAYKAWKKLDATSLGYLSYNKKPTLEDFKAAFPVHAPNYEALANPPADAIQAIWVGHASVFVQMEGVTFITDPVFSDRCSFSQWFGPRRVAQPSYEIEDSEMPDLDFVVISHNHYDHLDLGSVKRLYKRYGNKLRWYVPWGVKAWFKDLGIKNVVEADWWEEVQHPGTNIRLALTPAQHWSARGLWDRRRTLWGGWAVMGEKKRFWFAGDTGYCPVFKEIGDKYGPFDLSAIPIGAYDPREMLLQQHVNPAEAVQMHIDVKSKRSISIHCCTFFLTFEPMDEPPMKIRQELKLQNLPEEVFVTLQHGEMLQTADGVDMNSPKLLGQTPYGTQPAAAAWTPTQSDGLLDVPGMAAAAYHTKADAAGSKKN